jgi:hypothetical protein
LGALGFEFADKLAAEAIEFAEGQEAIVRQAALEGAEPEGRPAQAAQLLAQSLGCERLFISRGERHRRVRAGDVAQFVAGNEGERRARQAVGFHLDGALESWRISVEALAQAPLQFRVAGLPDLVARMDPAEVDVAAAKAEQDRSSWAGVS